MMGAVKKAMIAQDDADKEREASLRLIKATTRLIDAAPDLLAALQMLHDDIAEYASINNLGGFDNHAMRTARAAIAKAIGDA